MPTLLEQRTHTVKAALQAPEGTQVTLLGWLASRSVVGGIIFALVRDGTGLVQVAAKRGTTPDQAFHAAQVATREAAIVVAGTVRGDPRAPEGKEITVTAFQTIAPAAKWPITKSAVRSTSFLYDNRHLSLRGRKAGAVLKIRAELVYAAFDFFTEHGFVLISAPTLVQNAVEGGATLFQLDYFGRPAYLSQSAQLYEEAAICAFEKVFIYQPAFRAEKSKTSKHLTEFWMIEAEQAFAEQPDNLRLQEELVTALAERVHERCTPELRLLGRHFRVPARPFPRISYDEVRDRAARKGITFEWGEDLPTEAEKLISTSFEDPIFVTDYPLAARSFYHMTKDVASKVTLSADLLAPEGYGEIATGGQRVHDYDVLLERVNRQELPPESFQWYLDLRKYGLPPHSGFGLGVERTARWFCGLAHIRAACLFPRTIARIAP